MDNTETPINGDSSDIEFNDQSLPEALEDNTYSEVNVISPDGTVENFKTKDFSESEKSFIASADTEFSHSDRPKIPKTERADKNMREAWSLSKNPTQIVSEYGIEQDPEAKKLEEASKKYRRERSKLDDEDQRQRKVNEQSVYQKAEKIMLLENIHKYENELRIGRPLTEDEVEYLKNEHLQSHVRYKEYKSSYEAKNLTPEDQDILLEAHFKKEIEKFEKSLKDDQGKLTSSKCSLDQLVALRNRYKDTHVKAYTQDRLSRMESSDQEFTQKNKDEFMKENRNWSPELAKVEQQRDVAMRENELLREKLAQQEENGESTIEKTKKERDYKKIALIAGAVAGGATGLIGGVPAATVGITAVLVGRLSSFVADKLAEHNIRKLSGQIAEEQDNEIKSKLENKLKNWGKVVNVVQHIKKFLTGAALGLAGSSIVSGLFFGGKGVFDTLGAARGEVGNISMPESQPQPQPQPTSGFIETPRTAQVAQEAVGGGTEELIQGDWFNTSNLGWDVSKFNWKGSNLYVPSDNVVSGGAPELQGKFLRALFEQGVNKQHLMGQEAGEMFNRGLVDAVYRGADMTTTVQNTADALKALAQ